MFDLNEIRKNIDATDREIISLLEKRIGYSKEVAAYKKDSGKKVYDAGRERQKVERLNDLVEDPDNLADIQKIFEQIMLDSRKPMRVNRFSTTVLPALSRIPLRIPSVTTCLRAAPTASGSVVQKRRGA